MVQQLRALVVFFFFFPADLGLIPSTYGKQLTYNHLQFQLHGIQTLQK